MKNKISVIVLFTFLISGCGSKKKLETTAPFSLGEVYAQKWSIENQPETGGYEVIIPILSLDNDRAVLKNLYHKGKMVPLEIKLKEIGTIAIAEFGKEGDAENPSGALASEDRVEEEPYPFQLTETQAVISYVNNEKVKYYRIDGIRRNLQVTYPSLSEKNEG